MDNYQIIFKVDGKEISQEEIFQMEKSRYQIVFQELFDRNIKPEWNGRKYSKDEIANVSLEDAREILAETKEKLGRDGIRKVYAEDLKKGDAMWKDIAANSRARENLRAGIVEVETKGIYIEQFMLTNQSLAKKNNLALPSMMHPEHYSFEAGKGGTQLIIEKFGMYKYPAELFLVPEDTGYYPIPLDEDTTMAMTGLTKLQSDQSDTKIVGMHQFKKSDDGMKIKLGVFLPEATPDEVLEGHKWHLMVEFNNCMHAAVKVKPNVIQKAAIHAALAKMQKK